VTDREKARREALEAANKLGERLIEENPPPKERQKFANRDDRHAKVRRHNRRS
jgi:hypothetical protein